MLHALTPTQNDAARPRPRLLSPQSSVLIAGTLLALALTLLYAANLKAVLGQAGGSLSFLRLQFSHDPSRQLRDRDAAGLAFANPSRNPYRAAQVALAPVGTCPDPAAGGPIAASTVPFTLTTQETAELAKWVDAGSVIPICLSAHQLDRAAAYYSWSARALPGVQSQLIKLPAQMASAFIDRALARREAGDLEGSHADWGRALSFLAKPYDAFADLAETRSADHRTAQQALLATDVARDPSNALARIYLAQSYNASHLGKQALDTLAPLLKSMPDDTRVWQQKGQALVNLKLLPDAQAALEQAVRLAPNDLQALNRLGTFYLSTGNLAKAEQSFRAALATPDGPRAYWVWDHLGDALIRQNKLTDAAEAYRQALAAAPTDPAITAPIQGKLAHAEKK